VAFFLLVVAAASSRPPAAPAQTAGGLAASGIAAYRAVRYDEAASLLRRALDARNDGSLSDSARAVAYGYLAATELYRGRREVAAAATRQALAANPSYRPDTLVFPPAVTESFEAVRRQTRYVRIAAPADTTIQPGSRGYPLRLVVSAPHSVRAAVVTAEGTERVFYEGSVSDSAAIVWPVFERGGRSLPEGRLTLEIRSQLPGGGRRVVRLPLEASPLRADTLAPPAPPPDSAFLPERATDRSAVPGVSLGLLAGAATIVLPTVVAKDGAGSRARFALGGALAISGIAAFFVGSRGETLPANVATNRALMENWRQEAEAVRAENARRRGRAAVRIVAGLPTIAEGTP
jgi:hypothetical protein